MIKLFIKVVSIFAFFILLGCSFGKYIGLNQSLFLFKDADGLYIYEPDTGSERLIFKANPDQIFLDEPYELKNDTITFGFKGELIFKDANDFSRIETYSKTYYSVDLVTSENWLSKNILYEVNENKDLKITTICFDPTGKERLLIDTIMPFKGSSATSKGIVYNGFKPRFFSSHSLGDRSVYSLQGNIYYTEGLDTVLLVEFKGNFDPKFGSGYFQPQIDPNEKYVIFRYLPGLLNFKERPSLQKVDLTTKETVILKKGDFVKPVFSKDGKFLLFKRGQKQGKNNTWNSEIYLLDLETLKEKRIGKAYSAEWKD